MREETKSSKNTKVIIYDDWIMKFIVSKSFAFGTQNRQKAHKTKILDQLKTLLMLFEFDKERFFFAFLASRKGMKKVWLIFVNASNSLLEGFSNFSPAPKQMKTEGEINKSQPETRNISNSINFFMFRQSLDKQNSYLDIFRVLGYL